MRRSISASGARLRLADLVAHLAVARVAQLLQRLLRLVPPRVEGPAGVIDAAAKAVFLRLRPMGAAQLREPAAGAGRMRGLACDSRETIGEPLDVRQQGACRAQWDTGRDKQGDAAVGIGDGLEDRRLRAGSSRDSGAGAIWARIIRFSSWIDLVEMLCCYMF